MSHEYIVSVDDCEITGEMRDDDRGGWINYKATVSLGRGLRCFSFDVHHTAYIEEDGLAQPTDAQDFDGINGDLRAALGVLAEDRHLREDILTLVTSAACAAWEEELAGREE